ncbi:MAG: HEAT repeat domain-containing protein [Acidobacteriia bacterium]|nr:HEAT repeat domain-containing protein [Terriglobia bacterium]
MTCDSLRKLIPLYYYGELTPEEEDLLEEHLHECAACERERERLRLLAAALDRRQQEIPPLLLEDCRDGLMAAIAGGITHPAAKPAKGPWKLFLEAMGATLSGFQRYRQPVGALALIAIGFFAARFTGTNPNAATSQPASPAGEVFATVRNVEPDSAGRVRIAFDETRRRVVSGNMEDQNIQKLLLAAAHEENPAVRVESVGLLRSRADSGEVRDALLNAVAHDPNAGVRLKALEGLKPLTGDAEVRNALAKVLLVDDNPAVRMQVVDLLVARRDDSVVGVLQNLVQKENNSGVRLKCEKALKDMNASIGTF